MISFAVDVAHLQPLGQASQLLGDDGVRRRVEPSR